MKLFIIGQKWFGAEAFNLALRLGHEIAGVCAPKLDGKGTEADRLWSRAHLAGIEVVGPKELSPFCLPPGLDLIVAAHAHVYISGEVRARARHGAIGYHPSLLPLHRGRDAVRWTIRLRDPVAGGTVFRLSEEADAGPVVLQQWCFVRTEDTAESLWRRELGPMGLRLLERILRDPEAFLAASRPQDGSLSTWEPAFGAASLSGGVSGAAP